VPDIVVIAGPNGAGKTTFASEYLSREDRRFEFVNADEIARNFSQKREAQISSDIRAGKMMLKRIDELVDAGADFAIETTLASRTYARKIPVWRQRGYNVSLIYLRLQSVAESLARVRRRVEAGGHDIPEDVIRRRFDKSIAYFETIYKSIVDSWHLWESREGHFAFINSRERP
jgi:predicted ABC-type ATPase